MHLLKYGRKYYGAGNLLWSHSDRDRNAILIPDKYPNGYYLLDEVQGNVIQWLKYFINSIVLFA